MRKWLLLMMIPFLPESALADIDVTTLVKVSPEIKTKCVEYYNYQNDLYCSSLSQSLDPIDPKIVSYEKLKFGLDDRAWLMAGGINKDYSFVVEYIPNGDFLPTWTELVTTQFTPWTESITQPRQFFNRIMENIKNNGYSPIIHVYEDTSDEFMGEFQIQPPDNGTQDEIDRIIETNDGFYSIHYTVKSADMGEANRKKWMAILKKASIAAPGEEYATQLPKPAK